MKKTSFIFTLCLAAGKVLGQAPVTLQHTGSTMVFYTASGFQDAYNAAVNGDTIHLPGGYFPAITIDKQLVVIGAGHQPDSTTVTGRTQINGTIYFGENADYTRLEGLYITGHVQTNASDLVVNNIILYRCLVDGDFGMTGSRTNASLNLLISECVIRGNVNLSNTRQSIIRNNFFQGRIHFAYQSVFENNNFINISYLGSGWHCSFYDTDYCIFKNNIFSDNVPLEFTSCDNNFIHSNFFVSSTVNFGTNSIGGNELGVPAASMFVNQTSTIFTYTDDYHLQVPTNFIGNDGTQVGVYGGLNPWKDGSMPGNPHFVQAVVDGQTNANGEINVNVKVGAQDR